eukprot:gene9369-11508_t
MKSIVLILLIIIGICNSDYIYIKPFGDDSSCSSVSSGIGYLFNVVNNQAYCIPWMNTTDSSGGGIKVDIFGLIGTFSIYDNPQCVGTPISNQAIKHNQCKLIDFIKPLNVILQDGGTNTNGLDSFDLPSPSYSLVSFIDDTSELPNMEYGLRTVHYSSSDDCSPNNVNFQVTQFITNGYTFTDQSNQYKMMYQCTTQNNPTLEFCQQNGCQNFNLSTTCTSSSSADYYYTQSC